jgi:hypothetical protein
VGPAEVLQPAGQEQHDERRQRQQRGDDVQQARLVGESVEHASAVSSPCATGVSPV